MLSHSTLLTDVFNVGFSCLSRRCEVSLVALLHIIATSCIHGRLPFRYKFIILQSFCIPIFPAPVLFYRIVPSRGR